jgi:hypothetical protein
MKKYMKALLSFFIAAVCIFLGLTMETENKFIIYFLYAVGIVNIYIGTKDLLAIFKNTK